MKVCHITTAHNALDTRIFYKEAKSLAKAGYKVHVVGIHPGKETVDGIEIIPLEASKNRLTRMLLKTLKVLYLSMKTDSKIYHFHDPEIIPAGVFLKLIGKRVIYDAHEDYPQLIKVKDWIPSFFKPILSRAMGFFEKFASKFLDLTIAPSEPLSKRLPKGIALYNFPTLEILNILKSHSRPFNERDIDLIHVGVLRKTRLDFLIQVLGEIKSEVQIKAAFVGLNKEQIEYIKEKLGNSENILLIEKLPFQEVTELLGRSKIGLNYHPIEPHLKYAIPVKLFEYMGAGCVTVTSEFPYLQAIIGEDSPVIFTNHHPQKFAEAILELMKNPKKIEEISKLSQDFSLKFSWETEGRKLVEAYGRLQ